MKGSGDVSIGSREWAEFVRDNCRHEFGDYWPCIQCIAQAIDEAVKAEREAACKDKCMMCRAGDELVFACPPGLRGGPIWYHVNPAPAWNEVSWEPCRSAAIRARGAAQPSQGVE